MAIGAAIAGVVGGVGKGLIKKSGYKKAAVAREAAADLIGGQQRKTEANYEPWLDIGSDAFDRIAISLGLPDQYGRTADGRDFSEFYKSPGYQFRLDEGLDAVEASAAARGSLQSGATMKALNNYAQGVASEEYNNYINQLFRASDIGARMEHSLAGLGANAAANEANLIAGAGEARASGYGALADGLGEAINEVGLYGGYKSANKV